ARRALGQQLAASPGRAPGGLRAVDEGGAVKIRRPRHLPRIAGAARVLECTLCLRGSVATAAGRVREQREAAPGAAEPGIVAQGREDANRLCRNLAELVVGRMQLVQPCRALEASVPLLPHLAVGGRGLDRLVDRRSGPVDV